MPSIPLEHARDRSKSWEGHARLKSLLCSVDLIGYSQHRTAVRPRCDSRRLQAGEARHERSGNGAVTVGQSRKRSTWRVYVALHGRRTRGRAIRAR
jgi:hypothetical protein